MYVYSIVLQLLPLVSEHPLLLMSFVVVNTEKFQTNSDIYNTNTRHKHALPQPSADITSYQKDAYYAGLKLFSTLLNSIKSLNHDINVFKPVLKDYPLSYSLYPFEEITSTENY